MAAKVSKKSLWVHANSALPMMVSNEPPYQAFALLITYQEIEKAMQYYYGKTLSGVSFDEAVEKVTAELSKEGFGILTEIDVKETLKKKLDVDFKKYRILGACNPALAHKALQAEDKIGLMLPCNVIVEEREPGTVEVAAVDPVASMQAVENNALADVAEAVRSKLRNVIDNV